MAHLHTLPIDYSIQRYRVKCGQFLLSLRLELEKAQAIASAKEQFTEELAETSRRLEEEHRQQVDKLKQGTNNQKDTGHSREEWEREKERAVDEAVKQARVKWLEEREK